MTELGVHVVCARRVENLTTKAYTVTVSVALTVPFLTDPTTLTPTISITGASVSPASGAPHDFTTPTLYTVTASDLSTFGTPSILILPATPKEFASNSGRIVYINGTNAAKGIIYFDGIAFNQVFSAKTASAYTGLTYRNFTSEATSVSYLYGTRGSGGTGQIDEIPVSSLSTNQISPATVFQCPSETVTPNLIEWVRELSSFILTDQSSNGALGATTNGQIYRYEPTFENTAGALVSIGSGTLHRLQHQRRRLRQSVRWQWQQFPHRLSGQIL